MQDGNFFNRSQIKSPVLFIFNRFLMKKILFVVLLFAAGIAKSQKKDDCRAKEYVISGAQLANEAYAYAKEAYFQRNNLTQPNIDSSVLFIKQSINAIDSALILASDSELLARDYATTALKEANQSLQKLLIAQKSAFSLKLAYSKSAMFLAANVTADAYHSSFYFKNCKRKKETPQKQDRPKEVTKLDVDQTLFALLNEHLTQQEEAVKKNEEKLEAELKATKDPAKQAKLKAAIAKDKKEEKQLLLKDKDAKQKLSEINARIEERDRNASSTPSEQTVFSKVVNKPTDEWEKQVIPQPEIPKGLVYQVQIGIYKKAIDPAIFKGLTPIFSKILPEGICYMSGMFETAEDARQAKDYIQSIGLHDAFVVAYNNQKKISTAEAEKLEKAKQ